MRRVLPLVLLPVLFAAACATPNATPPGAEDGESFRPGDVVLRVEYLGGFVPAEVLVNRLPLFTLYGDGRVITEGPQIAIYPGPALPAVNVRTIDTSSIGQLVQLAIDAGVGATDNLGTPSVADVPSTVFTVVSSGLVRKTEVYALGFDEGLTAEQTAARKKLSDLLDKLSNLPATLGEAAAGEEKPYEPDMMAVLAREYSEPGSLEQPTQEERPWPGPSLPGPGLPDSPLLGMNCLTVSGAELDAVLEAAAWPANTQTPWVSDGKRYFVSFRPLLPDESTCADLTS